MIKGIILGVLVSAVVIASLVIYSCLVVSDMHLDDDERWGA